MAKILGLDPGTSSIGWGLVDTEKKKIIDCGSRIIPMTQDVIGAFERGNDIESPTKKRTQFRHTRRNYERHHQRRERLNRVLCELGFLPEHYTSHLDRYGKLLPGHEPKIAWREGKDGKPEFIFQSSYEEMLLDFTKYQPQMLLDGHKIPYDWTIYYLRKKALSHPLTKEELSWVLHQFNAKRGYYQLRNEEEEDKPTKKSEYLELTISKVESTGEKGKKQGEIWYNIYFEERTDIVYRRTSDQPIDWMGRTKPFILTIELDKEGNAKLDKEGKTKYSLSQPDENSWNLQKIKAEHDIDQHNTTLGAFIYDKLLQKPEQKIIGQLVRIVDRHFYKDEARLIVQKQMAFHPELNNSELYEKCIHTLYPTNEAYRINIAQRGFEYLLIDDVIFYQRPLKSQKSLIDNCPFEFRTFIDEETGEEKKQYYKCIPKSHPIFQEFRLWQFISNLKIYRTLDENGNRLLNEEDVTSEVLSNDTQIETLFNWLNDRAIVKQKDLLKLFYKKPDGYRWNYVEDKEYPANQTRAQLLAGLKKASVDSTFLTREKENELWYIIYSVSDRIEFQKAIRKYQKKNKDILGESFVEVFSKMKPFPDEGYGAFSAKAISRMLTLMRVGSKWSVDLLPADIKHRIECIQTGEEDILLPNKVRMKFSENDPIDHYQGLPLWKASYLAYGRHSEVSDITKWETPDDLEKYIKNFKANSLRNPIVEQVILETLRTVKDIWQEYGDFDEIHIEIGRDLKNPKDKRKLITAQNTRREADNMRIKLLLAELNDPNCEIEDVRPYSPSQQEILHLYEEDVWSNTANPPEEIADIRTHIGDKDPSKRPTKSQIIKYKCWLDQKYVSPYTGRPIPLAKLFTPAYQIEHIIPQAKYFDDSFDNKVICEAEVNQTKSDMMGMEFIQKHGGEIIQLPFGKTVKVFTPKEYEAHVRKAFASNFKKVQNLLATELPIELIKRQLNDSRYISRFLIGVLSNIVRAKDEDGNLESEAKSKNVIVCNGKVTTLLKRDWGVGDVWNRIILPRFERMNQLDHDRRYTSITQTGHLIPNLPIELQSTVDKKRIDHRHHAMDAVVIACCTRSHVNLISNEAALSHDSNYRHDLSHKLRRYEQILIDGKPRQVPKEFFLPWDTFPQDLYTALEQIIISFKQNTRVINKATNYRQIIVDGKHKTVKQDKGDLLAIRKPMHKATIFGEVNLQLKKTVSLATAISNPNTIVDREIKNKVKELLGMEYSPKQIIAYFKENDQVWSDVANGKIEVYYYTKDTNDRYFATRKDIVSLLSGAPNANVAISTIRESITDTGIQKILITHLQQEGNNPQIAFSPEGVDRMNDNLNALNDGHDHKPIRKVRRHEKATGKFSIGNIGSKSKKYVEAEKGTNLFFLVYEDTQKPNVRKYYTIPLYHVIECQKRYKSAWQNHLIEYLTNNDTSRNLPAIPITSKMLFVLTPGDLVYLPEDSNTISWKTINPQRIYKFVSSSGNQCNFVPHRMSAVIEDTLEYTRHHKQERAITGEMIKETCLPLKTNRLGKIIYFWQDKNND